MAGTRRLAGAPAFAILVALVLTGCGWTQYAGNAGRTGAAPLEQALTTANIAGADVRWTGTSPNGPTVVADGMVLSTQPGFVQGWPAVTKPSCPGSPPSCAATWFAHIDDGATSEPAVIGDTVYVATVGTSAYHLYAFAARGASNCSGPPGCAPKWVGSWGTGSTVGAFAPTVAADGGRVFVQIVVPGGYPSTVTAFDAAGITGCAGTPTVCSPLFRTSDFSGNANVHPSVAAGRLFVPTTTSVAVYDATGATRCTVGVCAPLYLLGASPPAEVAVADGQAFFANGKNLWAFDATGTVGCDGHVPAFCLPVWRGQLLGSAGTEAPVVAGTHVYATSITSSGRGAIEAFDRTPASDCSGVQLECPVRFRTATGATYDHASVSASAHLLLVASTSLPNPPSATRVNFELTTFDLDGVVGCSGTPRICVPVSTLPLGSDPNGGDQLTRPAVGAGLVVMPHLFGAFQVVGLP